MPIALGAATVQVSAGVLSAGAGPPQRAIVEFRQAGSQPPPSTVQILDASGRIVRIVGVTSDAGGVSRAVWDFHENGPAQWAEHPGSVDGAMVVPGAYAVRVLFDGKVVVQPFRINPDPRDALTQAQYQAGYEFAKQCVEEYGQIDRALNNLDALRTSLDGVAAWSEKTGNDTLAAQIAGAKAARHAIFAEFASLRESVPRPADGTQLPPGDAQRALATRFDEKYRADFATYDAFVGSLASLQTALQDAGRPLEGLSPVSP